MSGSTIFIRKLKSMTKVTACSAGFFIAINIYKGNENFYNNFLMPAVHKFIDPETSHRLAITACKYNVFPRQKTDDPTSLKISLFNHILNNPLGIAAGFDKHGEAVNGLFNIGFGFIEIGSVTPQPQLGNPKPRVFRLIDDKAIINRYGFNSDGHEIVYERLKQYRELNKMNGLIGVNLGKNKNGEAIPDYVDGVLKFALLADYIVINISSPNTEGLRDLQNKNELKVLISSVLKARDSLAKQHYCPILIKLAPDLTEDDVKDIAKVITKYSDCHIDGIIISNTTVKRTDLKSDQYANEIGGLSGAPLTKQSTRLIAQMYHLTKGKIPIIGVGGIFTGQDAIEKILAGASAIQLYTSFTYYGPPIVQRIKNELNDLLTQDGYTSVMEIIGKDYKKYI